MLMNDFYQLSGESLPEDDPNRRLFCIDLNPGHRIFEGHFPGNPVVPGVCLTEIIRELTGLMTGSDLFLTKADYIKFIAVVNPMQHARLTADIKINKQDGPELQAESVIFADNIVFLKFKGTFRK